MLSSKKKKKKEKQILVARMGRGETDYETWCLQKQERNEGGLWWLICVLYTQCEDAQENLETDDVDDVFSRLFFCYHVALAFSVQF